MGNYGLDLGRRFTEGCSMSTVLQIDAQSKNHTALPASADLDTRIALIQALIPCEIGFGCHIRLGSSIRGGDWRSSRVSAKHMTKLTGSSPILSIRWKTSLEPTLATRSLMWAKSRKL
jgi:hypothetical protein